MAEKTTEEKSEGGKVNKKVLLISVVSVVLLLAAGVVIYLLTAKDPEADRASLMDEKTAALSNPVYTGEIGSMVDVESFIINLLDQKDTRYLKAAITLEVDGEGAPEEINERMPQIRDAILLLVGNKTFDELRDLQGKMQLRAELIGRINTLLKKGKVKNIYFTDFVVQ